MNNQIPTIHHFMIAAHMQDVQVQLGNIVETVNNLAKSNVGWEDISCELEDYLYDLSVAEKKKFCEALSCLKFVCDDILGWKLYGKSDNYYYWTYTDSEGDPCYNVTDDAVAPKIYSGYPNIDALRQLKNDNSQLLVTFDQM